MSLPEFESPLNFTPPASVVETLVHPAGRFHVIIGLDPVGSFREVRGLDIENPVFEYSELGRNEHPVVLPFDGPRQNGTVELVWGTIIRNRFWNWFHAQSAWMMESQPVFIIHLSRRNLPLRVYALWGAWPTKWEYSDLGDANEQAVETLTLAYDRMFLLNPGVLALTQELAAVPVTEVADPEDPWKWDELPEDYVADKGTWQNEAIPEEYVGLPGMWGTEAIPQYYVDARKIWDPEVLEDVYQTSYRAGESSEKKQEASGDEEASDEKDGASGDQEASEAADDGSSDTSSEASADGGSAGADDAAGNAGSDGGGADGGDGRSVDDEEH